MKIVANVIVLIGSLTCVVSYLLYLNLQPKKEIKFSSYDIKSKWSSNNADRQRL